MIACAVEIGEVGDRTDRVDVRLAAWLAGFVLGGVDEEVVDHAMEQRGELVQVAGGPVSQGGLHVFPAGLADPPGGLLAGWGEPDELCPAVAGVGGAFGVAGLGQPAGPAG